jgi:hypothetical protein
MKIEIIDYDLEGEIKKLVAFAEENPFSMDDILDVTNGHEPPAGDREGYFFITPFGLKVVYSIENQVVGKIRHLSVSDMSKDCSFPSPLITREIMRLIGFENILERCLVDIEKFSETIGAVNVWERIKNG